MNKFDSCEWTLSFGYDQIGGNPTAFRACIRYVMDGTAWYLFNTTLTDVQWSSLIVRKHRRDWSLRLNFARRRATHDEKPCEGNCGCHVRPPIEGFVPNSRSARSDAFAGPA